MSIVFDHVCFEYDEGVETLHDISLEIKDGSFVGLAGHTGSGKSTLTQLMNALLIPTKGTVCVDGVSTADKKQRRTIRSKVGLVFQYPEQQLFANTVLEDVAFGPLNMGYDKEEALQMARDAIKRMGLNVDELAEKSPFDLSGGQQRRIALAGTMALNPKVLVLDEPMAGLDPRGMREMRKLLRKINAQGTTVVLVSHIMEDLAELCSDVVIMNEGRIILQGSPSEVFSLQNAQKLRDINLGLPEAKKCMIELEKRGVHLEGECLTLDQLVAALVKCPTLSV